MDELSPSYYFTLSDYTHAQLFDGVEHVWEALAQIAPYLASKALGEIRGVVDPRAYLIDPESIYIAEGAIVEAGAYIQGPCWIGEGTVVRHGAYVRGNVVTGRNCVIGHTTEVKNSIFLNKSQAAHFAYVGDSILGNHVNLGAGTKCANLKLAGDQINVRVGGKRIATGRRKFGVVLGDDVQLGCNSVTNPGTLMGPKAACYPCINIGGVIPRGTVVKESGIYRATASV